MSPKDPSDMSQGRPLFKDEQGASKSAVSKSALRKTGDSPVPPKQQTIEESLAKSKGDSKGAGRMYKLCPGCASSALASSPTHTRVDGQCQYSGPEWMKHRAPELEDDSPSFAAPSDGGGDPPPKAPSTTPKVLSSTPPCSSL